MKTRTYFQQAWMNIYAAKLRSFLAVLGILIGTAAVVALLNCGRLATEKALEQFKSLGTDLMAVSVYQKANTASKSTSEQVSLETWRQIPERILQITQIAPYSLAYETISFRGKKLSSVVIGADESLANLVNITMQSGYFLSFVDSFEHYCVIGQNVASEIRQVTLDNPIGKQVQIGELLYTIIGVAAPWPENGFFNEDINRAILVPIRGIGLMNRDVKIRDAIMRLKPGSDIDEVIVSLKNFIYAHAPNLNVFARSAKQIIASMESQGKIFTYLLAIIGSISLLVGGIGVMNVMLVSVSERRQEIGVRKALGARNKEIAGLFLTEAIVLSLFGGGCGILLGVLITYIVSIFSGWNFAVYWLALLSGFVVSVSTGIFFGFYPAQRAAKLAPVVSLRSS